jgi:hypothetical protein
MPTINLIIQQNSDSNLTPGSRDDLVLNLPVTVLNQSYVGITSYLWQFIDIPAGSAATIDSPNASIIHFTPDIVGTYLVKLTINGGLSGTVGAAIKTVNLHMRLPAAAEVTEFSPKGWARAIESALKVIDDGYGNLESAQASDLSGSGSATQIAVWSNASALTGNSLFTLDGYSFNVGGNNIDQHITTTLNGSVRILDSIDTLGPSGMFIGGAEATGIDIGSAGIITTVLGDLAADGYLSVNDGYAVRFDGISGNWHMGKNLGAYANTFLTGAGVQILDLVLANVVDFGGFTIGSWFPGYPGASLFELSNTGQAYFAGSVGIGTIPAFSLDINANAIQAAYGLVNAQISSSSTEAGIQIKNTSADGYAYTILSTGTGSGVGVGKFVIGGGPTQQDLITIDSGNVGVGTTGPTSKLDVNGDAHVSGTLTVDGTLSTDGYTIDLSAGATTNQVLQYNGTAFVAANASGGGSTDGYVFLGTQAQQFGTSGNTDGFIQFHSSGTFIGVAASSTMLAALPGTASLRVGGADIITATSSAVTMAKDVLPASNDTFSLGSTGANWHDGYFAGTVLTPIVSSTGTLTLTGNGGSLTQNGNLTTLVGGTLAFNFGAGPTIDSSGGYDLYLWHAGQNIVVQADSLIPAVNNTRSLGDASHNWFDGYFSNSVKVGTGITLDGPNSTIAAALVNANSWQGNSISRLVGGDVNVYAGGVFTVHLGGAGNTISIAGDTTVFAPTTSPNAITLDGYTVSPTDNTISFGDSSHRWTDGYFGGKVMAANGAVLGAGSFRIDSDGYITIDPTLGDMCILSSFDTGGGGNILSITISNGVPGQIFTLDMFQGNAAYTWPTTIGNARIVGGTFTKTAAQQSVDTITFRWNYVKTRWDEIGRAMDIKETP